MNAYEDYLKEKSLDELLKESQVLQQNYLDIKLFNEIKEQSLVVAKPAENAKPYEVKTMIGKIAYGGKCAAKFFAGFGHGLIEACFMAPTAIRRSVKYYDEGLPHPSPEAGNGYDIGYLSSSTLTYLSVVGSMFSVPILGYYLLISEHPVEGLGLLGTQIATNALSGLYEIGFKYEKKKLENNGGKQNGKS